MKHLSKIRISAFFAVLAIQFGVMAHSYFFREQGDIQYLPAHYHRIISVAIDGSSIEIEDGSQWNVPNSQSYEVSSWQTSDQVMISPNRFYRSNYKYYLTNTNRRSYVNCNLSLEPIIGGNNNYRIIHLDLCNGQVYLKTAGPDRHGNETHWYIDPADRHVIKNWTMNQAVIVGTNNNWFASWFSKCNRILINSECNTYVRAQEY